MFCHKCGQKAAKGAKFCFACGTKIFTSEANSGSNTNAVSLNVNRNGEFIKDRETISEPIKDQGTKPKAQTTEDDHAESETQSSKEKFNLGDSPIDSISTEKSSRLDNEKAQKPSDEIVKSQTKNQSSPEKFESEKEISSDRESKPVKPLAINIPMQGSYQLWFIFFILLAPTLFYLEVSGTRGGESQNQFPAFFCGIIAWNIYKRNLRAMVWIGVFLAISGAFIVFLGISIAGENPSLANTASLAYAGNSPLDLIGIGVFNFFVGVLLWSQFKRLKETHVLH
tara:strand:- start:478 stop:1326 length:849 start_codon:yes stop_codon:yes gene_type:complete